MKYILIVLFWIGIAGSLIAQTFNLSFSNPEINNTVSPHQLCVTVGISYTQDTTLGFSNLLFDFEESVLSSPFIQADYLNSLDNDYIISVVTTQALQHDTLGAVADLRILYDFNNGNPITLPSKSSCTTTQPLAKVCFNMIDENAVTSLNWVASSLNSSIGLNVNTHIQASPQTLAINISENTSEDNGCGLTNLVIDLPNTPIGDGGEPCESDISFVENDVIPSKNYYAQDTISTTGNVALAENAVVVFDAGNVIILRDGFTAGFGTTFTAKIMGCTPNPLPAVAFGEALAPANLEQLALEIIPNPVFQSAVVRFYVPQDGFVTVKVYDLKGKLIETLHQQYAATGWNEVIFYPRYMGSGMYFATVQTNQSLVSKRLVIQQD